MGNSKLSGYAPGIVDVLSGTACTLSPDGLAMIVKLERDADGIITSRLDERGRDRGIDTARHRADDADRGRVAVDADHLPEMGKKLLRNAHGGIDAGLQTKSKRRMAVIVLF